MPQDLRVRLGGPRRRCRRAVPTGRRARRPSTTQWAQPAVLVCSVASFTICGTRRPSRPSPATASASTPRSCSGVAVLRGCARPDRAARSAWTTPPTHRGGMAALMRVDGRRCGRALQPTRRRARGRQRAGSVRHRRATDRLDAAKAAAAAKGDHQAPRRRRRVPLAADGAGAAVLRDALRRSPSSPPSLAFWSSTTASQLDDPEAISTSLLEQLTSCVRFERRSAGSAASGPRPSSPTSARGRSSARSHAASCPKRTSGSPPTARRRRPHDAARVRFGRHLNRHSSTGATASSSRRSTDAWRAASRDVHRRRARSSVVVTSSRRRRRRADRRGVRTV